MAFNKRNLVRIDSGMTQNAPAHFDYNLETDETITTAGYIPKDAGIKAADLVNKNLITRDGAGLVTAMVVTRLFAKADADGVITLAALS